MFVGISQEGSLEFAGILRRPGARPWAKFALLGLFLGAAASAYSASESLIVPVETADLNSTLSQHAARTTTQTEPFQYQLRHPEGLTVLFNGSRGSKIEPCGCRALNLGGIDKEAAMVQTIRRANPQTLYMDAGGYFREFTDPAMRLQTWFMLKALAGLDCQVMNVGYTDLEQGLGALKFFQSKFRLPLISANIIDDTTKKPVFDAFKDFQVTLADGTLLKVAVVGITPPSRDVSRRGPSPLASSAPAGAAKSGGVTSTRPGRWMIAETNGYVPWVPFDVHTGNRSVESPGGEVALPLGGASPPAASGGVLPLPVQFAVQGGAAITSGPLSPYRVVDGSLRAQELGRELRKSHDVLILLAYTTFPRAVEMVKDLGDYDLIVAADYVDRMEPVRLGPEGPLVVCGDHEGKYLGFVEIEKPAPDTRPVIPITDTNMLPVLQTIQPLPQFHTYIDEFAAMTEKLPVEQGVNTESVGKIYAGSSSCRACHMTEYNQWKTHKHSHAMKTLVDRNMQYNPDCLKCHTVAYRQPGGFTDIRVTGNLANVQCEVCHGPAQAHVQEMRAAEATQRDGKPVPPMKNELRMEWNQNFCMQCHDPQNDPQFQFTSDIERVRHKNPAPPRVRPATMPLD